MNTEGVEVVCLNVLYLRNHTLVFSSRGSAAGWDELDVRGREGGVEAKAPRF